MATKIKAKAKEPVRLDLSTALASGTTETVLDEIRRLLKDYQSPSEEEVWDASTMESYARARKRFMHHAPDAVRILLGLVDQLEEEKGIVSGPMPDDTHRNGRCRECGTTDARCKAKECCPGCEESQRVFNVWLAAHSRCNPSLG